MTCFKYIKDIETDQCDTLLIHTEETNEGCLLEIAYQLKRIADKLK